MKLGSGHLELLAFKIYQTLIKIVTDYFSGRQIILCPEKAQGLRKE